MDLPQLPLPDPGGGGVDAPGGFPLGAEVLDAHVHPLAPDAPDHGGGEGGRQQRVLPEALLAPAPPGVPQDIQGGRQSQVHPHLPQLPPADRGGLLQQLRGPAGPGGQVHRQQVSVQALVSVGALAGHQYGDAQAGVVQDVPLDLVPGPGGQDAVQPRGKVLPGPGIRPVQAVQGPQPAVPLRLPAEFLRQDDLLPPPLIAGEAVQPLGQLSRLLPQGHAAQQIGGPVPGRRLRVHIQLHNALLPAFSEQIIADADTPRKALFPSNGRKAVWGSFPYYKDTLRYFSFPAQKRYNNFQRRDPGAV